MPGNCVAATVLPKSFNQISPPPPPPFLCIGHLAIEFNMRPNLYPESYDMGSKFERNEVLLIIPLMLLLVHIDMQAMINVRPKAVAMGVR